MIEVFLKICCIIGILFFTILGASLAMISAALLTKWFTSEETE